MADERPARGRRRAVGPAGARPEAPAPALGLPARSEGADVGDRLSDDDDERLRRDVPPHHGS